MADLSSVKVGDKLALRVKGSNWESYVPTHRILIVERVTATQVGCRNALGGSGEWRFRKSDGKEVGEDYSYAEIATQELLDAQDALRAKRNRFTAACAQLNNLFGKERHQLKLSLEQLEALAKAWVDVQALPKSEG